MTISLDRFLLVLMFLAPAADLFFFPVAAAARSLMLSSVRAVRRAFGFARVIFTLMAMIFIYPDGGVFDFQCFFTAFRYIL